MEKLLLDNSVYCQKMHQNFICHNRLHSSNLIKILQKYYTNTSKSNVAKFSISANNKFTSVSRKIKPISLRNFSEKNAIKPLDVNRNFATSKREAGSEKGLIVENLTKNKEISNLTKTLSIWSAAGISAFAGSYFIGDVSYGIAALPLFILHFDVVKDHVGVHARNLM